MKRVALASSFGSKDSDVFGMSRWIRADRNEPTRFLSSHPNLNLRDFHRVSSRRKTEKCHWEKLKLSIMQIEWGLKDYSSEDFSGTSWRKKEESLGWLKWRLVETLSRRSNEILKSWVTDKVEDVTLSSIWHGKTGARQEAWNLETWMISKKWISM